MTRTRPLFLVIAACVALLTSCHTMRFELVPEKYDHVVYDRKSFFLWGLSTKEVDVGEICPHGVAAIREQTTFTDGFFALPFFGIWEFRSSWYYCLPETPPADSTL
jgi:hypothetical protein